MQRKNFMYVEELDINIKLVTMKAGLSDCLWEHHTDGRVEF